MWEIWQIFRYSHETEPGHPRQDRQEKHHLHAGDCHIATKALQLSRGQRFLRWQERGEGAVQQRQPPLNPGAPRILRSASESSSTWAGIRQVIDEPVLWGGRPTSNQLVGRHGDMLVEIIVIPCYTIHCMQRICICILYTLKHFETTGSLRVPAVFAKVPSEGPWYLYLRFAGVWAS